MDGVLNRHVDTRISGGHALGERGTSKGFVQAESQKVVVLPCLLSESKGSKEGKHTKNGDPLIELE